MRMLRPLLTIGAAAFVTFGAAQAQTIKIGKIPSGNGFHIPTYVAMDQGFYKAEGLDAVFVLLDGRPMVTALLAGSIDLAPIPSAGAQAALSGAEIRYVVGESLKSQWLFVARPGINSMEDLRGKIIGYGRAGAADYDEGAAVMRRAFKMEVGKDSKVISLAGEPERIAALANGSIDAALISVPHAPRAINAGLKILLRTSDYIQRAGGTVWTRKAFADQNQDALKKFIRAIAKAVMFYRDDKAGAIKTLRAHLGVESDADAAVIWEETRHTFGAELPPNNLREILESRRLEMIAAKQWPADKPLPDPEQFLLRSLLDSTLAEMKYVPTKLDAK